MKTTDQNLIRGFNEWLRRYEDEPERFEHEVKTLKQFRADEAVGDEPEYGRDCVPYLHKILCDLGEPADDCPAKIEAAAVPEI